MENQNEQTGNFNQNQPRENDQNQATNNESQTPQGNSTQKENIEVEEDNEWSQKNEPHHDQTDEGSQQGNNSNNNADVSALKDQDVEPKDSENKQDNAGNAQSTSGHY